MGVYYWLQVKVKLRCLKNGVLLLRGILHPIYIGDNMATKEYVLKIGFDPITEEVIYIKEYIDKSKATLQVNDEDIELDDEISDYIVGDIMGIT
jgi:hypothetical protein